MTRFSNIRFPKGVEHPLSPWDPKISELAVPLLVSRVARFVGRERLSNQLEGYERELSHRGASFRYRAESNRPILDGFRAFSEVASLGATHKVAWPDSVLRLAKLGAQLRELRGGMPCSVVNKYAADLLDNNAPNFLFELDTAIHYRIQGFKIEWYAAAQAAGPEFAVVGGSHDFDVECRRFGDNLLDRASEKSILLLVDKLIDSLGSRGLAGTLKVTVPQDFSMSPDVVRELGKFCQTVQLGIVKETLGSKLALEGNVALEGACRFREDELQSFIPTDLLREWVSLSAKREGTLGSYPLIIRLQGPQRSFDEFQQMLASTLKGKVKRQLRSNRAGILAVRFDGLDNPSIFNEAPMQRFMGGLFKSKHLAGILIQGRSLEERIVTGVYTRSNAIFYKNPSTVFQETANLQHISAQR